MVALTRSQKLILSDLFKADGTLSVYTFYRRYHLPSTQLVNALRRLVINKLVELEGDSISLTAKGKEWVRERKVSLVHTGEKTWRKIPSELTRTKMGPWEPYIPSQSLLDKSFFKKKLKKKSD